MTPSPTIRLFVKAVGWGELANPNNPGIGGCGRWGSFPTPTYGLSINSDADTLVPKVLQGEFRDCDVSVGNLWRLDPIAWDYESMKVLHGCDVGIRISFQPT